MDKGNRRERPRNLEKKLQGEPLEGICNYSREFKEEARKIDKEKGEESLKESAR